MKSWPEFFGSVLEGRKTFELRKNDRNFKVGDILWLREWEPLTAKYSGREIRKRITYMMEGVGSGAITPMLGLSREYVIIVLGEESDARTGKPEARNLRARVGEG